jgi:hypothetical protein
VWVKKLKKDITMKFKTKPLALALTTLFSASLLTGCLDSDSHKDNHDVELILIFANSTHLYGYDLEKESTMDLSSLNSATGDQIGGLVYWEREHGDHHHYRAIILKDSGYTHYSALSDSDISSIVEYKDGAVVDMYQTRDDTGKQTVRDRANEYIAQKQDWKTKLEPVVGANNLCNFKLAKQTYKGDELEVYFALTKDGKVEFYKEGNDGLASLQTEVILDSNIKTIADCSKTSIVAESEEGILLWVADTQKVYRVDSHEANYHLHGTPKTIANLLGTDINAHYMVGIAKDDHDH